MKKSKAIFVLHKNNVKTEEKTPLAWLFALLTGAMLLIFSAIPNAYARTYTLPNPATPVVGENFTVQAGSGMTVARLARQYDIGIDELVAANPHLRSSDIPTGTRVVIPALYILPEPPWTGIVINLAEKRLYYFPVGSGTVETYPVGIGRVGSEVETPLMKTRIIEKKEYPDWRPPAAVKAEAAANGIILPDVMPAGPKNPLGDHMMRMSSSGAYLLHGTNRPLGGVGTRVSSGCIRMYPEDIASLYSKVAVGTPVNIIHQAFRAAWSPDNVLYFEAQMPLEEYLVQYDKRTAMEAISEVLSRPPYDIDWQKVRNVAAVRNGITYGVGYRQFSTVSAAAQE